MSDKFGQNADSVFAPARNIFSVTPSDSVDLPFLPKAVYIGGAGNITFLAADNSVPVTLPVLAGAILPWRLRRIFATGTTATGIAGLA